MLDDILGKLKDSVSPELLDKLGLNDNEKENAYGHLFMVCSHIEQNYQNDGTPAVSCCFTFVVDLTTKNKTPAYTCSSFFHIEQT